MRVVWGRTSSFRHSHADICIHKSLSARWDRDVLGGVDIVAGCEGAAACGETAFGG